MEQGKNTTLRFKLVNFGVGILFSMLIQELSSNTLMVLRKKYLSKRGS